MVSVRVKTTSGKGAGASRGTSVTTSAKHRALGLAMMASFVLATDPNTPNRVLFA